MGDDRTRSALASPSTEMECQKKKKKKKKTTTKNEHPN